ncbi:YjbF family lipoprotein [Pseudomonadota bacterium]|nr:YjbF family lipoprotein [Pseudomonadota bacterium]
MIRIFLTLILISSCGNLPIAYIQNFSSVNSAVFGFPDMEITEEVFEDYEYSFIKVRFGRGPVSILILAFVEDNVYEWSGLDDVSIYTLNGRVIKTTGLVSNIEIISPDAKSPDEIRDYHESINLYNPDLFSATLDSSVTADPASFSRFGSKVNALRVREDISIGLINWNRSNYYYYNPDSTYVEKTKQYIHPRLAAIDIEFFYKF